MSATREQWADTGGAPAGAGTEAGAGPGARVPGWLVGAGSGLLLIVVAVARLHRLFTFGLHEDGDMAVNSLSVLKAERLHQLVGNYSRVGFHHPGPALFYLLAAGQAFFHGLLHLVPGPANGQELGVVVFGAVLVGVCVQIMYRLTGSLPAAALTLGILAVFGLNHGVFGQLWFPYLYIAPYLLLLIAGAAVAAGHTHELPWYVIAASILVQGHISFLMFIALTTLAVATGWYLCHRGRLRSEVHTHPRALLTAAALLTVFLLPMIADLVLHFPGQWPKYLHYVLHGRHDPRTTGDILRFFGYYWHHAQPLPVTAAAIITALVLLATEHHRDTRRLYTTFYAMTVLQSLLTLIYITRGVDTLTPLNHYVALFSQATPTVLTLTAATHLTTRLTTNTTRATGRTARTARTATTRTATTRTARAATTLATLTAATLILTTALSPNWHIDTGVSRPYANYPQMVTALQTAPQRAGRKIELHFPHDEWPVVAGVIIQATRTGLPHCVKNASWALLFNADNVCRAAPPGSRWQVSIAPPSWVPPGATVVWGNRQVVLFALIDQTTTG